MPRFILKLTDPVSSIPYYMEWSTVVDAPVTYGMSLDEFKEYYRDEYGSNGMNDLEERLQRVEATGCSSYLDTADEICSWNRAGDKETSLTLAEIIKKYCIDRGA